MGCLFKSVRMVIALVVLVAIGATVTVLRLNLPGEPVELVAPEGMALRDRLELEVIDRVADWQVRDYIVFKVAVWRDHRAVARPFATGWTLEPARAVASEE